jgi:hypothetical protein
LEDWYNSERYEVMTVLFFFFLVKNLEKQNMEINQFMIFNASISVYCSGNIFDIVRFILKLEGIIPSDWIAIYGSRNF